MLAMLDIAENFTRLRETIAATARNAGRDPDQVKLIAVSKTHPIAAIETLQRLGQQVFGESTVQESLPKIAHFAGREIEWHFVGHLQSNKAKALPGNFSWIHSLDNVKLAQRLARLAQDKQATINALIEVNVTGDRKKHGVAPADVFSLLEQLLQDISGGLVLRGLMTIGPYPATEKETRSTYATLRQLRDDCARRFRLPRFTELSMGMSDDYPIAIAEGSTMIRIGTALFGERDYGERDAL